MSSHTLIDHIYTNDLINKITPAIIIDDISDHFPTLISVRSPDYITKENTVSFRDMKKFNADHFLTHLGSRLSTISHCLDNAVNNITKKSIDNVFNEFHESFLNVVNFHAPIKTVSR